MGRTLRFKVRRARPTSCQGTSCVSSCAVPGLILISLARFAYCAACVNSERVMLSVD